jgi:hypothetical protein
MNKRVRASKEYIGVAFDPVIKQWLAYRGQNTKVVLARCGSEIEAAQEFNRLALDEAETNGGFILRRLNIIPEQNQGEPQRGS